ncbi:MAG: hypothetical protein HY826_04025 [Actinobacteria bacterium]|nr:hypothetical protein [Actinomycetota bacterium]
MHKFSTVVFAVAVTIGAVAVAGCSDDKPSAEAWRADVVALCDQINADFDAGGTLFRSETPSLEEVMAYYADVTPKFAAGAKEIESLERPDGLDSEVDELFAALDAAVAYVESAATDRAVLESEIAAADQAPEVFVRLETASTAAGLEACNG